MTSLGRGHLRGLFARESLHRSLDDGKACGMHVGAAVYVTPNDEQAFARTLAQLMDDPNRRMALGAQGRCRIQTQLAWEYSIPHLLSLYREVLPAAEIVETVIARESKPATKALEAPDADMHAQASQPQTVHSHAKKTTAHLA